MEHCACPDTDPVTCILLRYPFFRGDREAVLEEGGCECICHDIEEEE